MGRLRQLHDVLFEAIEDRTARTLIRHLIIREAFADRAERVKQLRRFESRVYRYAEILRGLRKTQRRMQ